MSSVIKRGVKLIVVALVLWTAPAAAQSVSVDSVFREDLKTSAKGTLNLQAAQPDSFRYRWRLCAQLRTAGVLKEVCRDRFSGWTALPPAPVAVEVFPTVP